MSGAVRTRTLATTPKVTCHLIMSVYRCCCQTDSWAFSWCQAKVPGTTTLWVRIRCVKNSFVIQQYTYWLYCLLVTWWSGWGLYVLLVWVIKIENTWASIKLLHACSHTPTPPHPTHTEQLFNRKNIFQIEVDADSFFFFFSSVYQVTAFPCSIFQHSC